MLPLLAPFAPLFSRLVWRHAPVLVVGAILAPGQRTVAVALRAMGRDQDARFGRYYRVRNRARWSGLAVGRALLTLLVAAFAPAGPLLVGLDETAERRRGGRIAARGIARDAPVNVAARHRRGERAVEVATDTAAWYHSGRPPVPPHWALIRDPQGTFAPYSLLCSDPAASLEQVPSRFMQRRQLEVTSEEVRRHLGIATRRRRSEPAIRRATPALVGLFSLVTLLAQPHMGAAGRVRQAAWYRKPLPTFADALALVRRQLWEQAACSMPAAADVGEVPRPDVERLTEALSYAA